MDWIYGIHTVNEIIKYSSENITDFCILDGSKNPRLIELCHQAQKRGIKIRYLNNRDLSELVDGLHQGVAILCKPKPYLKENELLDLVKHYGEKAFILVLDGVTDPRNIGSLVRSAVSFNIDGLIIKERHYPSESKLMYKAASGSMEYLNIFEVSNINSTLKNLREKNFWVYGFDGKGNKDFTDIEWKGNNILLFGSEGAGMHFHTSKYADFLVKISIDKKIESLNISNSATIVFHYLSYLKKKS